VKFNYLLYLAETVLDTGPEGTHHLGGGWYGKEEGIALYRKVDGKFKKVTDKDRPTLKELNKVAKERPPSKSRANDVLATSDHEDGFVVTSPARQLKPKKQVTQSPTGHEGEKAFKEDLRDHDDKKFYTRREVLSNFKRFRLDGPDSGGKYPKKYDQIIDRMLNTDLKSDKRHKSMSFYTEKTDTGAGSLKSRTGELMSLMSCTMDAPRAKKFFHDIKARVKEMTTSGQECAIDESWVDAAEKNRRAVLKAFKGKEIVAAAWDAREDVNALGMDYDDAESSTDAFIKTVDKDGLVEVHEVSLKKDDYTNFKNGWFDTLVKGVFPHGGEPEEINKVAYKSKLNKKLANLFSTPEIAAAVEKKIKNKADLELLDSLKSKNDESKVIAISAKDSAALLSVAAKLKTPEARAVVKDVINDRRLFQEAATKAIMSNHQMVTGLLDSVRDEFPIKSVATGRETMIIGDKVFDQAACAKMFGTDDMNDIREHLKVAKGRLGRPVIVYSMGNDKKVVEIADLEIREKPIGSSNFALNLSISEGFTKELAKLS